MQITLFLLFPTLALSLLPLPTAPQLAWQKGEIMALIHFNMATFFRDGDPGCDADNWPGETGSSNPNSFNPTDLNISQWADAMEDIMATEAVITGKHGCGFYIWDTQVQLPRGGGTYPYHVNLTRHGDILRQFVDTLSARGIGAGIYYSLTNNAYLNVAHHNAQGNASALPGMFPVNQTEFETIAFESVKELWTQYGNLTELWFDGGYSGSMQAELTALLNSAQPNAVAFGGAGISNNPVRWAGSEGGDAPGYPTIWSTGDSNGGSPPDDTTIWNPPGDDFTLQQGDHWFYVPGQPLNPLSTLIDVYHRSVGCNGKLELDFAISRTGQLDPAHRAAYAAFGAWMRRCYGTPLASVVPGEALVTVLPLVAPGGAPIAVDRVMMRENLSGGQNVASYLVEYQNGEAGAWVPFGNATTIGNKKIHVREGGSVNATALRLTLPPSTFPPPYHQFLTTFAAFDGATNCGVRPHTPPTRVLFKKGGLCLTSNASSQFPCPGGANNACPVFLGDCASPSAVWDDSDGTLQNVGIAASSGQSAGINVDCDATAPGAVAKLLGEGSGDSANPITFTPSAEGQLVYTLDSQGAPYLCLDAGGGPYSPPCGREPRSSNQVATQLCTDSSTQGWSRVNATTTFTTTVQ